VLIKRAREKENFKKIGKAEWKKINEQMEKNYEQEVRRPVVRF